MRDRVQHGTTIPVTLNLAPLRDLTGQPLVIRDSRSFQTTSLGSGPCRPSGLRLTTSATLSPKL